MKTTREPNRTEPDDLEIDKTKCHVSTRRERTILDFWVNKGSRISSKLNRIARGQKDLKISTTIKLFAPLDRAHSLVLVSKGRYCEREQETGNKSRTSLIAMRREGRRGREGEGGGVEQLAVGSRAITAGSCVSACTDTPRDETISINKLDAHVRAKWHEWFFPRAGYVRGRHRLCFPIARKSQDKHYLFFLFFSFFFLLFHRAYVEDAWLWSRSRLSWWWWWWWFVWTRSFVCTCKSRAGCVVCISIGE